ncbi:MULTISPECIES: Nif11-like leader peptide family RiPP precursor [unclassified Nostoc]|uniref:Nif11-like leader peptide family RiPP precursor n=2 Tax=Nostoc TaxID=1177 RepID=UPI002AD35FF4|nr:MULTISPECIES: Nif11-like leader peptide family RiPP precursor [unclassified Nostoc]MDZ8035463.1 Nif11-like leader peptide family RiPP precursor [Nostoc sp. DedSLP04]MDZ8092411.1 Nif11-like leader peptide family RiPP precursor [Nostoc sp. DedQUE05]MDZ8140370.1 Nif11-like leader peptide family RiPP precursor [Nostoc sp. DedQUE04]
MENKPMLHQIKELLQNVQLQQQVKAAANQAEAIKVIAIASAEKGYNFTVETISQMLAELTFVDSNELSEEELLSVSGGMMADSAAKLCHTASCGGGHAGCC